MDLEEKSCKGQIKDCVPVNPFLCKDQKRVSTRGLQTCYVVSVTPESKISWQQTYFEGIFLA